MKKRISNIIYISIVSILVLSSFVPITTSDDDYFPMASEIQNLDITDPATAGQNVTVTFQSKSNPWQTVYYGIGFSTDNTPVYTDDWVVNESGIYNSTMANVSHDGVCGGKVGIQEDATPVWHDYSIDIMIPLGYSGNYYVIVIAREGYVSCRQYENQWDDSTSLMFTVANITQSTHKVLDSGTNHTLNATDVLVPPTSFWVTINDADGDNMNITIMENSSGWKTVNQTSGSGLSNGTYSFTNVSWITSYNTTYYITFNVTDGTDWCNETYHFTTIGSKVYVDDNANPSWYDATHVKTIQEGVDNVSSGGTIYVWAGTYNENVIANKTASLIGNSSTNTTINGGNAGSTVKITADWVNLTGFSITNSIASDISQKAGVRVIGNNTHIYSCNISNNNGHGVCVGVDGSDYYLNNISNSNISSNGEIGVSLLNSYNNSVYNNTVISSVNDRGIFLEGDYSVNYFNNISYNLIERSNSGIEIEGTNHSIWNNTVLNNTCSGISFAEAGNVTVYNNNITLNGGYISGDNYFGLMLESSNNNTFYNNYVSNINNSITYNVYEVNCNYGNVWNTTKQLGSSIIGGPYLGGNYWSDYSGHDSDNDGLGNTNIPYNSSGNISIGGDYLPLCTAQEGIVADVSPDVWIVGNINLGEYAINNFTFWQNGTDNIDITVTVNATNYTFVNWSQWQSFGHNRFCGNFTTDSWSSETTIEPGYPSTSILKSNFPTGNFTFGIRMWMPKTTTSYPSKQEDFDIVLTVQEHT